MINRLKSDKRRAVTLMEIAVTIFLVTLIGCGIICSLMYCRRYSQMERERSGSMRAAARKMEELKRTLFAQLEPGTESVVIDDNRTPQDTSDDVHGTLTVTFKSKDGTVLNTWPPDDNRIRVEIDVTWHPAGSLSRKTLRQRLYSYLTP